MRRIGQSAKNRLENAYQSILYRFTPEPLDPSDTLTFWRVRILFTIIFSGMVLGTPAMYTAIMIALREGTWGLVVFNSAFFIFAFFVLLSRRLSYTFRTVATLSAFYTIGLYVILFVGILSGGPAWLFAFSVLMGVFFEILTQE